MDYKQLLEDFILNVIQQNGSDLHLGAQRVPVIRVSGELIFLVKNKPLSQKDIIGILTEILDEKRVEEFMDQKELDFSYDFQGKTRLRGNAFVERGLINLVFRVVPKVRTFEELGLPSLLNDLAQKRQGFFLVVGPVGHGKSTTLAAMVNVINQRQARNIITIEDPIEHIYEEEKSIINQREVGIDTKSFGSALKAAFREDVNVILVGEMRTPENISIAVTAAETGHLVLSTLHTNNAAQTIDRIIDTFPGSQQDQIRAQLAVSLLGIFSQRLIPKITGGLVPAYELLLNNNAVSNLIREKRTHEIDIVIETGSESGMIDLNHSLLNLVRSGAISIESAFQYSLNPSGLQRMLK